MIKATQYKLLVFIETAKVVMEVVAVAVAVAVAEAEEGPHQGQSTPRIQ